MQITPEMINALLVIRNSDDLSEIRGAVNLLDNEGFFSRIDDETGYDTDPEPERVSKCTCGQSRVTFPVQLGDDMHADGCPGDPAEWGDMAFTRP